MTDIWKVRQQIRGIRGHAFTKAKGVEVHARRRLGQRYGLTVNREEYKQMCRAIMQPDPAKAQMIHRQSQRYSHWLLEWRGKQLYCLFDAKYHRILTFFKPEWREKQCPEKKQEPGGNDEKRNPEI